VPAGGAAPEKELADLGRTSVIPFRMRRMGLIMEPDPNNPLEAEGVLNPAAARGPDGHLYLFPRIVARGNFSRIGIARVRFDEKGDPAGVERMGIALEPEAEYELRPDGGGVEDPRISFVEPLGQYIMTYTAYGPRGPRIAMASSPDLFHWERVGLAEFDPCDGTECNVLDFTGVDNKDGCLFPVLVPNHQGVPSLAMIHRPLFKGTDAHETMHHPTPRTVDLHRESIWISYSPQDTADGSKPRLCHFQSHHRLACPVASWERLKVGGGAPPVQTPKGWVFLYHGVSGTLDTPGHPKRLRYSAGVIVLDRHDPWVVLYRSPKPILSPDSPEERQGAVSNVVFPTGVDVRTDLGKPRRVDVYYGMADDRIGAATFEIPETCPEGALTDPHGGKV
jgi:beta-1,2-mannobiose phosphorylase / 1,2-beta-oligomannan phosphorylase